MFYNNIFYTLGKTATYIKVHLKLKLQTDLKGLHCSMTIIHHANMHINIVHKT